MLIWERESGGVSSPSRVRVRVRVTGFGVRVTGLGLLRD